MSISDLPPTASLWLAKGIGALAGSAISIAYVLPRGRREAALRFAVGMVSGVVFGGPAGVKLAQELEIAGDIGAHETALGGAAVASLAVWWVLGFALRLLNRRSAQIDPRAHEENRP